MVRRPGDDIGKISMEPGERPPDVGGNPWDEDRPSRPPESNRAPVGPDDSGRERRVLPGPDPARRRPRFANEFLDERTFQLTKNAGIRQDVEFIKAGVAKALPQAPGSIGVRVDDREFVYTGHQGPAADAEAMATHLAKIKPIRDALKAGKTTYADLLGQLLAQQTEMGPELFAQKATLQQVLSDVAGKSRRDTVGAIPGWLAAIDDPAEQEAAINTLVGQELMQQWRGGIPQERLTAAEAARVEAEANHAAAVKTLEDFKAEVAARPPAGSAPAGSTSERSAPPVEDKFWGMPTSGLIGAGVGAGGIAAAMLLADALSKRGVQQPDSQAWAAQQAAANSY